MTPNIHTARLLFEELKSALIFQRINNFLYHFIKNGRLMKYHQLTFIKNGNTLKRKSLLHEGLTSLPLGSFTDLLSY